MISKTDQVLKHLKKYGSITSWTAINRYHATRLSGIIWLLRRRGYEIESIWIEKPAQPRYVEYIYSGE